LLEQRRDKELLKKTSSCKIFGSDPDTIRTCDPQLRRLLLYPLSYGASFDKKYAKELKIRKIFLFFYHLKKSFANITQMTFAQSKKGLKILGVIINLEILKNDCNHAD
jgi:hypothetical protein